MKKYALVLNRIPILGILAFTLLYIYASTLYPGGSQTSLYTEGFDWLHNYWCNLMGKKGVNGVLNPARPFAILAIVILCTSLTIFYFQFANFLVSQPIWKYLIKVGGSLSMFFTIFMFTKFHDEVTIISSFFGLFLVIGLIRTVYKSKLHFYQNIGVVCLLILALNNYIYYTSNGIIWLPLIQKITFLVVLVWILGLNQEIRKNIKSRRGITP